jgi:hypothetical protein
MFPPKLFRVNFRLCGALIVLAALAISGPGQETQPESTPPPVVIQPASDSDLGFDLMHMEIIADGRLPSQGTDYAYRVLSVGDQGNCVGMCPATLVYVVFGNVSAKRDEKMKLYRIEGVRFMHFPKATVLDPESNGGFFLALRFTSMPHPRVTQHYIARFSAERAVVERDGVDNPAPAHHFDQFFKRPGAGIFRITLTNGNVFRLKEFEIFDPEIYGQADGWSAAVVESAPGNPAAYQMKPGTHFGAILESDITEIFDEGMNETVFTRKD